MIEQRLQSGESAGGDGGKPSTSIDLRKPADLNLVYRAVVNGWEVPQAMRNQIAEQLEAAMEAAEAIPNPTRRSRRILKLCKLLIRMDAQNMIAAGHGKSAFPYLRRRFPEKRWPRCRPAEGRNALL